MTDWLDYTDAKVEKRPIPHAPVASPYAGASVPKIVYVSSSTPFMSAVKRIQKLLLQAEKRATASINLEDTRKNEKQKLAELANISSKREEVFVKATGRAIEKALNVGKWFEEKETEYSVRVKTGSVIVVDDVVEDEEKKEQEEQKRQRQEGQQSNPPAPESKSAAKKRKRQATAAVNPDAELPESRTRWVKMVEVAVSLK
jgi:ribonuclease P/MRP protein subunit POP7